MKRLILSLCIASGLTCAATSLPADSLASAPEVARFYEGCMKIAEAETATDPSVANSAYAKAMDLLNTRSTYSRKGIVLGLMKAEIIDDSGMATEKPADFAYDYAYARARYKSIDFAPKGMSRGLGKGCRVLDLAIKPGGKVVCRDNVKGNCILVAMADPVTRWTSKSPLPTAGASAEQPMMTAWWATPDGRTATPPRHCIP